MLELLTVDTSEAWGWEPGEGLEDFTFYWYTIRSDTVINRYILFVKI